MDRGPAVRPNWNRLFEIAAAQEGLFTTKQAAEARYSPQLLTHYVHAGRAIRVGRSIYRLVHFPAGEHEELVAAGACRCRSGPRAIWRARRVTRTYSTPAAFKQALEQRLRTSATSGAGFARKRHRWLHVSSGLHDVEPRDLLEVARVRGKQRAPDAKADAGNERVSLADRRVLEALVQDSRAFCSHFGQRVNANTTKGAASKLAFAVRLEATPDFEDRDSRYGKTPCSKQTCNADVCAFALQKIHEDVGIRDHHLVVQGVSRAA